MNINDIAAIVMLFIAITDTLIATFFISNYRAKNPHISQQQLKILTKAINIFTFASFAIALIFYLVRPL